MKTKMSIFIALLTLGSVACGSSEPSAAPSPAASQPDPSTFTWQTEGCPEPAPLIVESSAALETDVALAADSLAQQYGVSLDEARRRLRLQQVLSERLTQVQAAEAGRVARTELQHEPTFAAVVTLTGSGPISDATSAILCRTPELEIRLGATFTADELVTETNRLARLLTDFGSELTTFGPVDGELQFQVVNDPARERLDALLSSLTDFPYSIDSFAIPPLVIDPTIPFPLLDVTGKISAGVGLEGVLTIEGPCVYLGDALVILPARETRWDPATGVLNTGAGDVRSGDRVIGGGNDYRFDLAEIDQPPDPSCRTDFGVLQASFGPIDPNVTPAPVPPGAGPNLSEAARGVPPEPPNARTFVLQPRNPQAAETFTAMFDPDNSRGGYFLLQLWEGSDWSAPRFILESDANGAPSTIRIQGEFGVDDYGVGGPGPDTLLMPADIEPGQWRLCTANAAVRLCTQITILE